MTPPEFTQSPTIGGDTIVGGSVYVVVGTYNTTTVRYVWSNGADTGDVAGLTLVESDVGQMLTCTVTLSNADGDTVDTTPPWGPIEAAPPPPITYTPTVADVAALIRARTKDSNGNEVGTFNADTRPTDVQAQEAIDHALIALHEKVGTIGDLCTDVARMAATYGAAAEIELSYFPEQARTDRSPYTYLLNRYTALLDGVEQCVLGNLPSNATDDDVVVVPFGHGTMRVTSGVVDDYYGGRLWPVLTPLPPAPDEVEP